ncbi:hypothetical protein JRO89_XS07G0026400 [Xanthoceras sorbifolium]|uniref:RCC1-like domain-containing protein n=1 Tax=Xanthoceras sorbifolium TaxID=99658 RepID=A0ABQ8HS67_9ROSI|nr:hypothetical protein JRO89_XS07G0026400 [Xanthoceras sorbifolium]
MAGVEAEKKVEDEVEKGGELLFCGSTCWNVVGRRKGAVEGNLVSPTRLRPLVGVNIRFVASGCALCVQKGQLGHGDKIQRDRPTVVSELAKYKISKAGLGRSHTVVITEDGHSLAFGWNKHGQLGSGSARNETEPSPVRCLVSEVKDIACGADFNVWLSSTEGASILTAGLPQYGQLGHGTDNEYNTKDSSVRLVYEAQPRPRAIASLAGETIVKVACGSNHTVAVDSNGYVYTWGFGGYGRLGHREQKDEWVPRRVDIFTKHNVLPPNAIVSAGALNSACTAGGGQLYMWGKIKNTGDDWMYPKPLMDLSGWNIRCMDSGNMHHFVGADNSCISWGHALYGELGYGPNGQKSSAIPKKVDILEGMHVIGVACGFGHSMVIVDRANVADRLDQFGRESLACIMGLTIDLLAVTEEPESKTIVSTKKGAAKASDKAKKRKQSNSSSESEEEENSDDESDDSEEQINGQMDKKKQQAGGRGRGKSASKSSSDGKSSGRGRGRPPSASKSSQPAQAKAGKRGRPRKS